MSPLKPETLVKGLGKLAKAGGETELWWLHYLGIGQPTSPPTQLNWGRGRPNPHTIYVFIIFFICFIFLHSLPSVLCGMCAWTVRMLCAHPSGMLTLFFLFVSHQACLGYVYSGLEQTHFSYCSVCAPLHYSVSPFYFKNISYSSKQPSALTRGLGKGI